MFLLLSYTCRVPIHTLRKCAQALEKMFEQSPETATKICSPSFNPPPPLSYQLLPSAPLRTPRPFPPPHS